VADLPPLNKLVSSQDLGKLFYFCLLLDDFSDLSGLRSAMAVAGTGDLILRGAAALVLSTGR